ncbi:hypothetical protein [Nonomuraea aurantiaca]|uniref:hypothetical protein n=1 Tax=Nonomuraea aurantiaca TaxID=2878562 RepID=UPI001CD9926A|nr:hypothetical protein [Nonomuraea aurantiaca]MCA2230442.1 hypothetical protein [Nonomuraea aurantiaca]
MWKVRRELAVFKILGALACAGLALFWYVQGDVRGVVLAVPAALLVGAMGLRDVLVPVRLVADESGVTVVHGFTGRRVWCICWGAVTECDFQVRVGPGPHGGW